MDRGLDSVWSVSDLDPAYAVVTHGSVTLVMSDGSTTMANQGDTILNFASLHDWANDGSETARK